MRLSQLNPKWIGSGGEGVYRRNAAGELEPAPERKGIALRFDCPCGRPSKFGSDHGPIVVNVDPPLDGGPPEHHPWKRTGDTFETLTLEPSIRRVGGCNWHGWIRNGDVL